MTKSLPVLMYHYISKWANPISVHPDIFEEHCKAMQDDGWQGVSLDAALAFLLRGEALPAKSVLITFDDGYLDNYVYAWPILKKYGHHGVIFAVTDKILTSPALRPSLLDVWQGSAHPTELPPVDAPIVRHALGFDIREDLFFSWAEAGRMEAEGTMRIAPHSQGHLGVYAGPEFDSFWQPQKRLRTFDKTGLELWGMPQFKQVYGLANTAFIPSPELIDTIVSLVPQEEDAAFSFFLNPDNTKKLQTAVASLASLGAFEKDWERKARIHEQIAASAAQLEDMLGTRPECLCWPWGAWTEESRELAFAEGLCTCFATTSGANPAKHPGAVHRFKVRPKPASWLLSRLRTYSSPFACKIVCRYTSLEPFSIENAYLPKRLLQARRVSQVHAGAGVVTL